MFIKGILVLGYFKNVSNDDKIGNYKEWLYKNGECENKEDVGSANAIPLEYNLVFLKRGVYDFLKIFQPPLPVHHLPPPMAVCNSLK